MHFYYLYKSEKMKEKKKRSESLHKRMEIARDYKCVCVIKLKNDCNELHYKKSAAVLSVFIIASRISSSSSSISTRRNYITARTKRLKYSDPTQTTTTYTNAYKVIWKGALQFYFSTSKPSRDTSSSTYLFCFVKGICEGVINV
jgi:hypothetical protein